MPARTSSAVQRAACRRVRRAAARSGRGHRDRGSGGNAESVLELLYELRQLEQRHLFERVEQLVGAELRHGGGPSWYGGVPGWLGRSGNAGYAGVPSAGVAVSVAGSVGSSVAGAAVSVPGSVVNSAAGSLSACSASCCRSASASRTACDSGAANRLTACDSEPCRAPASFASRTALDSRSASRRISSAVTGRPSSTPPLINNRGWVRAKSRTPLAATTGSPSTKAIAVGPSSNDSSSANPACCAAILVRVFLTTAYRVSAPSARRNSVSCETVSPRYSVNTAAVAPVNASVSSATAAALSDLGMDLFLRVRPVGAIRKAPQRKTPRRRARGVGRVATANLGR